MLSNYVAIYVPSTFDVNKQADPGIITRVVNDTASRLANRFGGCTAVPANGYWISDTSGLISESVTILKSYFSESPESALQFARDVAASIKALLCQESVTVESNSGIDFI